MQISSSILASIVILLGAAGLIYSHLRSWKAAQQRDSDAEELDFRRRQFRRRMQTSALLAVLAVSIVVGELLTLWLASRTFAIIYWGCVLLGVAWIGLLAAADIWATRRHFGRLRHGYLVEQAKLEAQIRRIRAQRGNGKAAGGTADIGQEDVRE